MGINGFFRLWSCSNTQTTLMYFYLVFFEVFAFTDENYQRVEEKRGRGRNLLYAVLLLSRVTVLVFFSVKNCKREKGLVILKI